MQGYIQSEGIWESIWKFEGGGSGECTLQLTFLDAWA